MAQNKTLRASSIIWHLRVVQLILVIATLCLSFLNAGDWHDMICSLPQPLTLNIVAALVTLPVLIYYVMATGPHHRGLCITCLPWDATIQAVADVLLLAFWAIPSIAVGGFSCNSVCASCTPIGVTPTTYTGGFHVWVGRLTCSCYAPGSDKDVLRKLAVAVNRKARLRPGTGSQVTKILRNAHRITSRKWADWAMCLLLATTLTLTMIALLRKRNEPRGRSRTPVDYEHGFGFDEKRGAEVSVTPIDSTPGTPQ